MSYLPDKAYSNPSRFLEAVITGRFRATSLQYSYIILGRPGPTGKTWLYNGLKLNGYKAFELSEDIIGLVDYRDDDNHYLIDDTKKQVIIILNKDYK